MSDIVERLRDCWVVAGAYDEASGFAEHPEICDEAAAEIGRLRGIVEFGEAASRQQREGLQAEIERLKAALREIDEGGDPVWKCFRCVNIARAALEGK